MATVIRNEAMKLAKADAEADLALLVKGEAPAVADSAAAVETEPFGRQGNIPGLGSNPQLVAKAFETDPGSWLPEPYAFPTGYVLAKTVAVTPPTEEQWSTEKDMWLASLNQRTEEQVVQAYVSDLRAKADVRITNPAMLDN